MAARAEMSGRGSHTDGIRVLALWRDGPGRLLEDFEIDVREAKMPSNPALPNTSLAQAQPL